MAQDNGKKPTAADKAADAKTTDAKPHGDDNSKGAATGGMCAYRDRHRRVCGLDKKKLTIDHRRA